MDPIERSIIYNDNGETAECDTWAAELIIELRAKNAALREALEDIATRYHVSTTTLRNVARAALVAHKNHGKENP